MLLKASNGLSAQPPGQYKLVFLTESKNHNPVENIQAVENEHLRTISRLADRGLLVNAGPFEGGGELLILITKSRAETEELLNNDRAFTEAIVRQVPTDKLHFVHLSTEVV
jgi:uncharacterized protein YciI